MSSVVDLLLEKQHSLHTVSVHASVLEATQLMNDRGIGAVVVTDADLCVGIFTERDVLRRVVAQRRCPLETCVSDVMTREVLCIGPESTIEDAREIMMLRRVRHLPIVDSDGQPIGMLSIGDLNAHQVREQAAQIGNLHDYLYGRV